MAVSLAAGARLPGSEPQRTSSSVTLTHYSRALQASFSSSVKWGSNSTPRRAVGRFNNIVHVWCLEQGKAQQAPDEHKPTSSPSLCRQILARRRVTHTQANPLCTVLPGRSSE